MSEGLLSGSFGSRLAPFLVAAALAIALVAIVWIGTPAPATRTVSSAPVAVDASRDFSAPQIVRAQTLAGQVRPWALGSLLAGLLVSAALGFTSWGAWLMSASTSFVDGANHPWRQLILGGFVLLLVGRLSTLPFDAAARAPRVSIGLVTQSWGAWLIDVAKSFGITVIVVLAAAAAARGLIVAFPQRWWIVGAAGAGLLVIAMSFVYPVVIEPLFNRFTPMPDGALRTSLLELADRDGIRVDDVLVADASRRTSAVNAYVSGLGASRRIVVYDNLVTRFDEEQVRSVVSHELGHVKDSDVRNGTLMGALGASLVVCLIAGLLGLPGVLRQIGTTSTSDPRVLPFVLAVVMVLSVVALPLTGLVSRRIEARADVHALELTRDPATLIALQRDLALTNISDPSPPRWLHLFLGTHPTAPQRIAVARQWAAANNVSDSSDPSEPRRGVG